MITAISISHARAAVAVRERFALSGEKRGNLLASLRASTGRGVAVVATCNRLEVYATGAVEARTLLEPVMSATGVSDDGCARAFVTFDGLDAVRHLFRVATGLESLVLGESEILGQVRTSFSEAAAAKVTDPVIDHLFHSAVRAGRRARAETAIGSHSVSVSALTARVALQHLGSLAGHTALIVGTGEAGRLAATVLRDLGISRLIVSNRTLASAQVLAESLSGEAVSIDRLEETLPHADVVIACAGAGAYLLGIDAVRHAMELREGLPMIFLDIGVPRDIDPAVAQLANVTLVDLDALAAFATENAARRQAEVAGAERIIDDCVAEFAAWIDVQAVAPTIRSLATWAELTRQRQVARALRHGELTVSERERLAPVIDALSRSLVKQILHRPVAAMRGGAAGGRQAEAVRALFDLTLTTDEPA